MNVEVLCSAWLLDFVADCYAAGCNGHRHNAAMAYLANMRRMIIAFRGAQAA
jgi:hypothetical protein